MVMLMIMMSMDGNYNMIMIITAMMMIDVIETHNNDINRESIKDVTVM